MGSVTWEELGALTLARQFPTDPGPDAAATLRRTGPVQSQTARSPFLALAARRPGVTRDEVATAYDGLAIVRGSTLRGTLHTTVPEHHVLLHAATRVGQRRLWQRTLGLQHHEVEDVWEALEDFARDAWRTPDELHTHLLAWLGEHGEDLSAPRLTSTQGRNLAFTGGGLVRRPRNGAWEGQGPAEYRTASALLGERSTRLADPHVLDELVQVHLAAHGPASRQDLAWWAGLTLTVVDEVLARLDLTDVEGPDGRTYVDLPGAPAPVDLPGVRLLPEFDALMCAYERSGRQRFLLPEHHDVLWGGANGQVDPPLLVDGRITGSWRAAGSARRRPLTITSYAGTRAPRRTELEQPVAALEAALGITVTEVTTTRG
ncbi:MAG: Winged helix DNA-binding protein [Marmoricola sp.]|nr:Winged helix DNA-binding protein [Marmoricola sp.]